jgi:hypothetical protein
MSIMAKENKRYENTEYSEEYSIFILRDVLYPEKAQGISGCAHPSGEPGFTASAALRDTRGIDIQLRVPRLASAANQTRAISGLSMNAM